MKKSFHIIPVILLILFVTNPSSIDAQNNDNPKKVAAQRLEKMDIRYTLTSIQKDSIGILLEEQEKTNEKMLKSKAKTDSDEIKRI